MSHKTTEGYSSKNPVPKVALKSLLDPASATEFKAKYIAKHGQDDEQRQNAATTQRIVKGAEVQVKDPVTGEETTVKHAGDESDDSATIHGENVLSMDFPPPDWSAHRDVTNQLTQSVIIKLMAAYTLIPPLLHLLPISIPFLSHISDSSPHVYASARLILSLIPPTIIAYSLLFSLRRRSSEDFDDRIWQAERERGLAAGADHDGNGKVDCDERVHESAEWLNAIIRGVWPIINSELFNCGIDMLEDIMQSSVPQFIHSVRVADLGQGSNAFRVTALRSLPDADVTDILHSADDQAKDNLKRDHVNIEMSFAYRALPSGTTADSKAQNAHLLIEFFLGLRGVWGFRVPVWVELTGMSGNARARLELIPDPPFVRTTIVTLMGLPRISIAVVPMARSLPNMMNMPIVSNFISKSIDAACAEYVAPKSLTLNLQQLISGDDIKKDTEAIGIILVHIHRATGIKKMDSRGSSEPSDPYVTLAYARQGKPLYSTRIIQEDLNPVFEENTALTVDANAIKIGERLSLQLWDSDRASADDMMGFVEVNLLDLIRDKNTPTRRSTPLTSPDSEQRPGTLEYTVGYYAKMVPNASLATDGSDPAIPEDLKQRPEFRQARAIALNDLEAAVLVTPPDTAWPSGVLSVQVHEIRELAVKTDCKDTKGNREGQKGRDDDAEEQEESEGLPSSYCTIAINDDLVYSTRVKPITATPTFNAGTERFIRDWRTTHVSVVVRDSRMRENDPILGIIFLKLSELFVNASQVTRFFPMENGIGYGSARISVLFRPVKLKLPLNLLGFDTGTLAIRRISLTADRDKAESLAQCEIRLKTSTSSDKISKKRSEKTSNGTVIWHEEEDPTELPVRQRYSSALIIGFKDPSGLKKSKKKAMAVVWLRDLADNEDKTMELALWQSSNYSRLKQNYIPPDGNLDDWDTDREKISRIGTLQLDVRFQAGITSAHKKVLKTSDTAKRRVWDEVDRRDSAGLTEKVGQREGDRGRAVEGVNAEVDKSDVQVDQRDQSSSGAEDEDGRSEGGDSNGEESGHEGLLTKLKEWKKHERELHRQHRGIMQKKPARTATWLKENVQEAGHKVRDRFAMKTRQPDVETEA